MAGLDPARLHYHIRVLYSLILLLFLSVLATLVISFYLYQNVRFDCTRCLDDKKSESGRREKDSHGIDRIAVLLSRANSTAVLTKKREKRSLENDEINRHHHRHRHYKHNEEYLQDEDEPPITPWVPVTSRISTQEMVKICRSYCEKGEPGPIGPPGKPGFPGAKGQPGIKGEKGDTGYTGAKGHQGMQGYEGLPGPKGTKGDPGARGLDGLDGRNGLPGTPGLDGIPGKDGMPGSSGLDGKPGTPGLPGRAGINGRNGTDGKDGVPGPHGPKGSPGLHGARGKKGEDGMPGRDGEPGGQIWKELANGTYLLPAKFVDGPWNKTVAIREGDNVRISCVAVGTPEPKVTWQMENGSPIPTGRWLDNVIAGPQLNLTRVNRIHTGTYECVASNALHSKSVRKYITLNVLFAPYVVVKNSRVAPINSSWVILTCRVEMFPSLLRYWVHPGGRIIDINSRFITNETIINKYTVIMTLNITRLQRDDYGDYKCFSKNDLGNAQGVIRVHKENDSEFLDYLLQYVIPQTSGQVPPPLESYEELCPLKVCPECQDPLNDEIVCVGGKRIIVMNLPMNNTHLPFRRKSGSEGCIMTEIGKPVFHRDMNGQNSLLFGGWMKDPVSDKFAHRIWLIRQDKPEFLFEYENKEKYHKDDIARRIKLKYRFAGNTHLVYNGSFYYTTRGSNNQQNTNVQLVKLDLSKNEGEEDAYRIVTLTNADTNADHYLYSTNHSYVDFAADENGLWLIHGQMDSPNTIVSKVSPDTMLTERIWNLTLKHQSVGEMFIVCGVVYAVENVTSRTTNIQVAFDLYQNQMIKLPQIEFSNPFMATTMISYNFKDKELLSWDKGSQLSYPIKLRKLTGDDLLVAAKVKTS